MLLLNANVITLEPAVARAAAVRIDGDRIAAVGSIEQVRRQAVAGEEEIDLGGATVIPGFNEAHCHLLEGGMMLLDVDCAPAAAPDIPALVRQLKARAENTPPGEWIIGRGYDVAKIAENRHVTARELDAATSGHPILLYHVCTHLAIVNSLALERMDYTPETPDPPGGRIGREDGTLTGRVDETAMPRSSHGRDTGPPPRSVADERKALDLIGEKALRLGITSATDVNLSPDQWAMFQKARAEGKLPIRVRTLIHSRFIEKFDVLPPGDAWLRILGFKAFADGAIAGRTACLNEPYVGTDDCGILCVEPDELTRIVTEGHRRGGQVGIHANGDRTIAIALDAIEAAMKAHPRPDPRHRLEHGTVMTDALIARTKQLGVVVVPFGSYCWHHGEKMVSYGDRIEMMFAHRSLLDAGVPVAGSSDHPCAPLSCLLGVHSCVNRTSHSGEPLGQRQRISPQEALALYTAGSAYATFEEDSKGRVRPGMLADLAVLAEDPTTVDVTTIKDIAVKMTIVGGQIAWSDS